MTAPNQTTETIEVQGSSVPLLGFGTWQIEGSDATEAVRDALEIGYRQIDTARAYGNEAEVGEGIAQSGVDREQIFLTTKIFPGDFEPDALKAAAEDSLHSLRTDYLDLLLLHWPDESVPLERTLQALAELREAASWLPRSYTYPGSPASALLRALLPLRLLPWLDAVGARATTLKTTVITRRVVAACHGAGVAVHAWTVNDPGTAGILVERGVDAIITDDPRSVPGGMTDT